MGTILSILRLQYNRCMLSYMYISLRKSGQYCLYFPQVRRKFAMKKRSIYFVCNSCNSTKKRGVVMKNHKFIYNILIIFGLLLLGSGQIFAVDQMTLLMQEKQFNNIPYMIEDGELLAPARLVLEELGGKVEWYGGLKVLRVLFDEDNEVKMSVDNVRIAINPGGNVDRLPVPPRMVEGQTMVPLKYFVEYFGLLFKWDEEKKIARVFKPANWVLDLTFEEGLMGEKLIITSTKKVPYVSHVLGQPDRLVIDLQNSSLSSRSSDILWKTYVFNSVRLSQYDLETVRVVIELNNQVQYQIIEEESQEGFKVIVVFAPGIRDVHQDNQGIMIKSSGEIGKYSIMELSNPDRLVIDLEDQTLQMETNSLNLDNSCVKQVRASQLSWDPKITRLVLDLQEKIEYNVLRGQTAQEIIVQIEDTNQEIVVAEQSGEGTTPTDPISSNQEDLSKNTDSTQDEYVIIDVGQKFGDHELVSIGITEGINQRVIIKTSTPIYYNAWYLPNPDRLVVDLQGTTLRINSSQIPQGAGIIKNVRMHQYPDKVRVVFDLNQYVSHNILSESRSQVIEIGLGNNPLEGKVIIIDPGHGGSDPGAIGIGGLHEKVVTLEMGLLLKDMLRNAGATVIMTRDKDVYPTLGERVDLANQLNADIFVSLHCNSFNGEDPGGTETFIPPTYRKTNRELAAAIHTNLVDMIQLFDRGIKSEGFYVLNHTTMPAVLVEVAFVSKKEEVKLLKDPEFLNKAITGIYEGILAYFTELMESGESQ